MNHKASSSLLYGRRTPYLIATLMAVSIAATGQAGEQLRWKFNQDEVLMVDVVNTNETATVVNNKTISMTINMSMSMRWTVDAVDDDGAATMTQEITRLAIEADLPGSDKIQFDSKSDEEASDQAKEVAASVKPLIGARFGLTMSALGEIVDVSLPEETEQTLRESASKQLASFFSKETIVQVLKQSTLIVPEGEVEVDETWKESRETTTPAGKMKEEIVYTFAGIEDGIHQVTASTTIALDPKSKRRLKKQTSTKEFRFDNKTGDSYRRKRSYR